MIDNLPIPEAIFALHEKSGGFTLSVPLTVRSLGPSGIVVLSALLGSEHS